MKCVAYVSRVPIQDRSIRMPTGLSDIITVSSKHNPESQITGIISYREGQYLQVLEGPSAEVDKLMAKIASDPRHEDIWVFLDQNVTERSFKNWGVSVFDFVDQSTFFDTFIENNSALLNGFNEQHTKRIQPFFDIKKSDTVLQKDYKGRSLKLLAWPDLNHESNPQLIIALCVKLTNKPYPFDALISSGEFGPLDQVTKMISGFELSGILDVTDVQPLDEKKVSEKKPNKFYGAIKKFLGMR
ncbi:BLUF domain-containing protein [Psychrobacter sp. AOP7-B1-25]|uniref:BLUF domain-containing protein n=1 Tax=Psychrobacter sp. AOP7-B1-25 TaxID=3457644 RepID=UPI00402B4C9E